MPFLSKSVSSKSNYMESAYRLRKSGAVDGSQCVLHTDGELRSSVYNTFELDVEVCMHK
jgi:hypothetical protein